MIKLVPIFTGFIEEITDNSMSVQIIKDNISKKGNPINALVESEIIHASFPNPNTPFLFENYYYSIEISNNDNGIRIVSNDWPEITDVFFPNHEYPKEFWINFDLDFYLTEQVSEYINRTSQMVSRGEKFSYAIFNASTINKNDSKYNKWVYDLDKCNRLLKELMHNQKNNQDTDIELFFEAVRIFVTAKIKWTENNK